MSNKISRRNFLHTAGLGTLGAAAAGLLTACGDKAASGSVAASAAGTYTVGTYSATATGINTATPVTVTMTFSEDAITDCKITSSGNDDLMKDDLRSSMAAAVVESQGDTSVDAITSSTLSFSVKAVQEAVADCIAQATA